jgi:hypothetical protein
VQSGDINCQAETGTPPVIPETSTGQPNGDGCWRPPCEDLIFYSYNPSWEELDPNTPWIGEYVLLDGFNDTCLPSGQYDFYASGLIAKGYLTDDGKFQFDSEKFRIERILSVTITDNLEVSTTAQATISGVETSG